MINSLYSVSAFVYALVLIVILIHDKPLHTEKNKEEGAFRILLNWVIYFCLQDMVWGLAGGNLIQNDKVFFVSSTIFHLSTVTTTFFWLYYILTYLSDKIRHPKRLLILDGAVIFLQISLLITNCFKPIIFTIDNGVYVTEILRPLAFFDQYVVYLLISILTAIFAFRESGENKKKYITVFFFTLAPVLSGVFQLLYPDGPFYSIGYFLGCFIIYVFVVSKDRENLYKAKRELEHDIALSEQIRLANTDQLSKLKNRRSYEEDLLILSQKELKDDFVYISMDLNGLKIVNDNYGHTAGDEYVRVASYCIERCLGSYGSVYRIGGDEFAALVYADEQKLKEILKDLEDTLLTWRDKSMGELSISYGYVRKEASLSDIREMAKRADEKMYAAKEAYYINKGVDRQGQSAAFKALCKTYTKILRINITDKSYNIIVMDNKEKERAMGFAESIDEWLKGFGRSGYVHPEDLDIYYNRTDLAYLSEYFRSEKQSLSFYYRRRYGNIFKKVTMELIPTEEYTHDNQSLFLYVKEIDK